MKIAFFGTPDFAVPSLEALTASGSRHEVVCIVCQPDKPAGRGGKVEFGPVKRFGLTHGIPVLQPERISREINILDKYKPDIIVTCAFGQFLKQNVLDYCKHGVINVHGSLLPKLRGTSPVQWAIITGENKTGITTMHTDAGWDTGDIILSESLDIGENENAGELFERMSHLGAHALVTALDQIQGGTAKRTPQDNTKATYFPKLSKEDAKIDFSKPAHEICNFVRGMNPWPVAWFEHNGEVVRVFKAAPGKGDFCFGCKDGFVNFEIIQLPGGKVLPAKDYINGRKIHV
jgi:methionyl-tRNA formyltransferase